MMSDVAIERLKARVERLTALNEQLTAENEELRKHQSIKKEADESDFDLKRKAIRRHCIYGMTHFCDGTVNRSRAEKGILPRKPCPIFETCVLRKEALYD